MSQMRYRKPSVNTVLGVTKWKKRAKKALGLNVVLWPFRAVGNYKRRLLRRGGYYRPEMKMMRAMQRGQMPGPIGPLQVGEGAGEHKGQRGPDGASFLMAAALAAGAHEDEGKGHKGHEDGPGLAQAMLLAAAAKGAQGDHHAKAPAHKEGHVQQAHPAGNGSAGRRRAVRTKPRHRALRLLGLVLVALLVTAAIVTVWYFLLA